jgi:hypothetical protein
MLTRHWRTARDLLAAVVVAEAVAEFEAEGIVLGFQLLSDLVDSSQVSGNFLTPTSADQSVRQFIN